MQLDPFKRRKLRELVNLSSRLYDAMHGDQTRCDEINAKLREIRDRLSRNARPALVHARGRSYAKAGMTEDQVNHFIAGLAQEVDDLELRERELAEEFAFLVASRELQIKDVGAAQAVSRRMLEYYGVDEDLQPAHSGSGSVRMVPAASNTNVNVQIPAQHFLQGGGQ